MLIDSSLKHTSSKVRQLLSVFRANGKSIIATKFDARCKHEFMNCVFLFKFFFNFHYNDEITVYQH